MSVYSRAGFPKGSIFPSWQDLRGRLLLEVEGSVNSPGPLRGCSVLPQRRTVWRKPYWAYGFAVVNPLTTATVPELSTAMAHLRDVLSDQTYESLARKVDTMTTAAIVTYASDQIDQARTELNAVSN